jgi:hypothetical protein
MYGSTIKTFSQAPISNRQLRRNAQQAIDTGLKAYVTLLTVLAQKGGEVVVTKGIIDQINSNLPTLGYEVKPNEGGTEFVIRMLEGQGVPDGGKISVGTDAGREGEISTDTAPA